MGKTPLIDQYVDEKSQENYISTVEIDFTNNLISLDLKKSNLKLWYCRPREISSPQRFIKESDKTMIVSMSSTPYLFITCSIESRISKIAIKSMLQKPG